MKRLLIVSLVIFSACAQQGQAKQFSATKISESSRPHYHLVVPDGDYDSKIDIQKWTVWYIEPNKIKIGDLDYSIVSTQSAGFPERILINESKDGIGCPGGNINPSKTLAVHFCGKPGAVVEFDVFMKARENDPNPGPDESSKKGTGGPDCAPTPCPSPSVKVKNPNPGPDNSTPSPKAKKKNPDPGSNK
jgi:hypothetical protein